MSGGDEERIVLPGAPNFQRFLEGMGDLEARLTDNSMYGYVRIANYAVVLDGKPIGKFTFMGIGDETVSVNYMGNIPGYIPPYRVGDDMGAICTDSSLQPFARLLITSLGMGDDTVALGARPIPGANPPSFHRQDSHESIPFP